MLVCHRSERCESRFQMPDDLGLPLSCGWATAVVAASRLVTLFFKNCIKKVMQDRQPRGHFQPLFMFATAQTKQTTADDRPHRSETTTNSVSSSSVLPPMAVIHLQFQSVRADAKTNSVSSVCALSKSDHYHYSLPS